MRRLMIALLTLLVASPAFSAWNQFQKNCKHTAEECDITIETPLCIKFRVPAPSALKQGGSPLTDDAGFVYLNSGGAVSKFNPKTGAFVWVKTGYDSTNAPGMIYNNTVIYSYNNSFRAHSLDTGNVVWQQNVAGSTGQFYTLMPGVFIFSCFPTLANGKIYSGNNRGQLVIVNADNGATINVWQVSTNSNTAFREILPAPAIDDDGTAYVGSRDGYFYAVDTNTGVIKWKVNLGSQVFGSASIDSTGVYLMSGNPGWVYKFNKADGSIIWSRVTGSWANGSGALFGDGYFCGSDDRYVYKFDKDTGVIKWKIYVEDNLAKMSCVIVCAKLYILGCIDKLITIDTMTGTKEFICKTLASNFTNIGVGNGELYFTSDDGYIYVVGKCEPGCGICSCDSHKLTPTPFPTTGPSKTFTATLTPVNTATFTVTRTATLVPTLSSTMTPVFTATAIVTATMTRTPLPTPTFTATADPCAFAQAPQFTVKMIFNPEATDDIIFEITSTEELLSPPSAVICPHGATSLSTASLSAQCTKKCEIYASQPVPGETKRFRILYPKTTGFGDIDSVTVTGTSACGKPGTSDGSFDKSVISGQDVKIFKNVIKPDLGERCIIHYKVYDNDRITVKIYNRSGQVITTLVDNAVKMPGEYDAIWDGKNSDGKIVASGIYTAVVKSVYYEATEKISVLR